MIKQTVIFDFDGTLADSSAIHQEIMIKLTNELQLKPYPHDYMEEAKKLSLKAQLKAHNISIFKLPKVVKLTRQYVTILRDQITPYPGIKELIQTLKSNDYHLILLSSNAVENIKYFLVQNQFDVFDIIIGGVSIFGKAKHLKRFKRKYAKNDFIYVGDEVRDIVSAHQAKMKSIAVTYGFDSIDLLKESKPDFLADDVFTLSQILLKTNK